jgi:hypothetical protein
MCGTADVPRGGRVAVLRTLPEDSCGAVRLHDCPLVSGFVPVVLSTQVLDQSATL